MTRTLLILILACHAFNSWSQDTLDQTAGLLNFPERFLDKINKKTSSINERLSRKTEQYLQRLIKNENRLKKKLLSVDSNAANTLFSGGTVERYNALLNKLQSVSGESPFSGEYLPYLDSLKGSLGFLRSENISNLVPGDVQSSLDQLNILQGKLQQAELVRQFIGHRKEQIRRFLSKYTKLPAGIRKLYADYSKQAFYYSQQIKEYKDKLNDADKMLTTALGLLNKLPAFSNFMKRHSMLASLFNITGGAGSYNASVAVTGLQTRDQVMAMLQDRMGGAPNAGSLLTQNIRSATQQIDDIRSRMNLRGLGGSELGMPDFKPNNQKSKTFWQRLEYGSNLQTVQGKFLFPITTDLGLSLGYRLNDKNVIGIGGSYKVGWGKDIRNISISSQGAGLRSFVDLYFKKSFYISGGFEMNYQPLSGTDSLFIVNGRMRDFDSWQQSGLIGVSKIVSLKTRFFKKTKLQLLWDFLSYRQAPGTPPLKFRVGYSF